MSPDNGKIGHGALVTLLAALAGIAPFSIDTYLPAFHNIEEHLNASPLAVQQTLSVYLLAIGIMALLHGGLSDAFGRRRILLINLAFMCFASLLCAVAPTIEWLLIGRIAQGISAGAGMVISRAIVRDLFEPQEAQRVMAHNTMIFSLAPAIAPIFGGWMLSLGWGWRSIFFFLAIYSGLLFILVYRYLEESLPQERRHAWHPAALLVGYGTVLRSVHFWLRALSATLLFIGMFVYVLSAPKFLINLLGLTFADFGWLFVPTVSGLLLGSWQASRLSHSRSQTYACLLGLSISAAAGVVNIILNMLLPPKFPWQLLPLPLFTLGMGLAMPALTILLLGEFPTRRGMVSSCQACIQSLGNSLMAATLVPLLWGNALHLAMMQFVCGFLALGVFLLAMRLTPPATETTAH